MAKRLNLQDVGTREGHLADLLELWNDTAELIRSGRSASYPNSEEALKKLENAVEQLQYVIGISENGYDEAFYRIQIDAKPKPNADTRSGSTYKGMPDTGGMAVL